MKHDGGHGRVYRPDGRHHQGQRASEHVNEWHPDGPRAGPPVHDEHGERRVNGAGLKRGGERVRVREGQRAQDVDRLNADERHEPERFRAAERDRRYGRNGARKHVTRWCRWGLACRERHSKAGCKFGHRGPPLRDDERVNDQRQDDVAVNEDTATQSEEDGSQDGEPDGQQSVENDSDGASASPEADGYDAKYEEDKLVSESYGEAAQVSNESNEDEELSNEQNTSIDSDEDGRMASLRDADLVNDDQDAVSSTPISERRQQPKRCPTA